MRLMTKALWAISLSALACGCTTKTDDGEPEPKYPDVAAYCLGRAQAECSSAAVTNCASPGAESCYATRKSACLTASPTDRTYRADQAEGCIGAVAAAYADAVIEPAEVGAMDKACGGLFERASGLAGVACTGDSDCKLSERFACVLRADTATQTITGTCQVPTAAAAGESCSAVNVECKEGLYCDTGSHCVMQGAKGEACDATKPCAKGLSCDATSSTCAGKAAVGASCASDADCADGFCVLGTNPVCVAKRILSPNEPACEGFR